MKQIEFLRLYEQDFNLSNLFALRQYWKENSNFKMTLPRKTSCLLWFCGCSAIYKIGHTEMSVPHGSVVYIPENAVYETRFYDCDDKLPATILIEFSLCLPDGTHFCVSDAPCILKSEGNVFFDNLFNEAADIYSSSVISLSKTKSIIYSLLSDLSHSER